MKSKRVLELKEFEAQYKQRKLELEKAAADRFEQLNKEIEQTEEALARYVDQEFAHYVKIASAHVCEVGGGTPGRNVYVGFSNGCRLRIPRRGDVSDTELSYKHRVFINMTADETTSNTVEGYAIEDHYINERLVACAEVFADAIKLVREVVPRWFDVILPELDVELLMTSRVLQWISKQVGGQWPDVVAGHVVDKIQ